MTSPKSSSTPTKPSSTVKTVSTRSDSAAAYGHLIQNIAGLKPDSDIVQALELYGLKSLPDLMDMERSDINNLEYKDKAGDMIPLHRGKSNASVLQIPQRQQY